MLPKEAIKEFRGLNNVLDASFVELQKIKGIGPSNAFGIKLFQEISKHYAKERISSNILFDSPQLLFKYLKERIGKEEKEHFTILYLDTRNKLIVDDVSIGTLNASLVHPREVFKRAILNNASHVVIAHNHPSGNPSPSVDDITTTNRLIESGNILGIAVIDHIIVTKNSFISLKEQGIIK